MYFAEDIVLCHKILYFSKSFEKESIFSFLHRHPHILLQYTYIIVADNRSTAFFIRVDFLLKISKLPISGERNGEQKHTIVICCLIIFMYNYAKLQTFPKYLMNDI